MSDYEALVSARTKAGEKRAQGRDSVKVDEDLDLPSWVLKLTPYRDLPVDGDHVLMMGSLILGKVVVADLAFPEEGGEGGGGA